MNLSHIQIKQRKLKKAQAYLQPLQIKHEVAQVGTQR